MPSVPLSPSAESGSGSFRSSRCSSQSRPDSSASWRTAIGRRSTWRSWPRSPPPSSSSSSSSRTGRAFRRSGGPAVQILESIDRSTISELLARDEFFWLDLERPARESIALLDELFDLHPLALEDTRELGQRPKLEDYEHHIFLVYTARASRVARTRKCWSRFTPSSAAASSSRSTSDHSRSWLCCGKACGTRTNAASSSSSTGYSMRLPTASFPPWKRSANGSTS